MKGKSRVRTVRQIRVCSCVWVADPALPGILSTACDDSDWKTRVFVPNQSSRAGKTRALCATSHRARTMSKGCMMARGDAPPCSPRGERGEEADMEDLGLERGAHGHAHVEGFLGSSKNTFVPSPSPPPPPPGRLHSIDTFTAVDGHGIRAIIFLQGVSEPSIVLSLHVHHLTPRRRLLETVFILL